MSTSQEKKEDLSNEEEIDENENKKYLLFKEIKKKVDENSITPKDGIIVVDDYYCYYENLNEAETFSKNSKFITFINEKIGFKKKIFIHNQQSLEHALKEAQIKNAIIINAEKEKKNCDSQKNLKYSKDINEQNAINEPEELKVPKDSNEKNIFQSSNDLKVEDILEEKHIAIKQDKALKINEIFSETKFNGRFKLGKVSELDFNFKKYKDFPINKDTDIDKSKINQVFLQELKTFYNKKGTNFELIIMGPRGVGKSINYIFNNSNEMEDFKKYSNNIPGDKDLIQFIYRYIEYILKFYRERKLNKKILIVLDDYDDSLDSFNSILNIEDLVYKNNNKILLCVLGHCPYIYKKYYNYLLDAKQKYMSTLLDLTFKEEEDLLKLPLYNCRYNNNKVKDINTFRKEIKDEIIDDFKRIELKKFFCLSKYLNIFINIENLKRDFEYFPFEFLNLERNNNSVKISFKLQIYKEVFQESIKGLLKIDNIRSNFNLNKNDEDNQKDGVQFEEIIVEQLWNNSLKLYEYPEKNRIRVNDIFSIKSYNSEIYQIEEGKNVIIRQTQFTGKYYDLLLIIYHKGKAYGIFVQIGLNKTRKEIEEYYNNLVKKYDDYKKGIKNLVNINIDEIGFLLIFDYERQAFINKKGSKTQGIGYCDKNKIAYLIYKDFQLYDNLESQEPITSINVENTLVFDEIKIPALDIFKNSYMDLCESMISENNTPCIKIEEEEKEKIIKYINKKYESDFDELRYIKNIDETEGLIDFGFFCDDFEQVNIIKPKVNDSKYISYKKEILKINKSNKLESIKEAERNMINNYNLKYDLYLLTKKRIRPEDE